MTHAEKQVLAKMREQRITDFTEAELDRVFANCVGPNICKRVAREMIANGLTIEELPGNRRGNHANGTATA